MESIYKALPVKLNPFISLIVLFFIAFVPHALKIGEVKKKAKESDGKVKYSVANSRAIGTLVCDDTPAGLRIAALAGCHTNGLEAFSYFAAAILSAVVTNVPKDVVEGAAALFIGIRVLYTIVYLSPLNGSLRSLIWGTGLLVAFNLIYIASTYY